MSEYIKQTACNRLNILVIGAGPCGLRAAIECALLGSNVVVVEQRDKFSRNNVLHLWGFVIQDLKALGAKIFYPKFCTGSIEHISKPTICYNFYQFLGIRQLQCILLKVALVLGVQVHENVGFSHLIEPEPDAKGDVPGWRAAFEPHGHILSEYEFDALIGADGKRNTLPGFPRQVVRGKLAIGITANFVNNRTSAEEKVQEISGVAYIFNQAFFKDMKRETGVDLENIVYYKDETHYFVMCAKKQSLLEKGVIKQDFDDISQLLSRDNVDQEMLCKYAAQAADFATHGKLPQLNYAQNHNGQADIAMFDFTALCSAMCSTRLVERCGRNLIMTIVGDSLHEVGLFFGPIPSFSLSGQLDPVPLGGSWAAWTPPGCCEILASTRTDRPKSSPNERTSTSFSRRPPKRTCRKPSASTPLTRRLDIRALR